MEKENKNIGFILKGIKTEQFAVFEENYTSDKNLDLGTNLQFKIDTDNKQIGAFLGFEFIQKEKVFLKIVVSCHFKIEEMAWDSFIREEKIVIPKGFLAHIAMITTGTTRGVLFAKTEGTPFSKYLIPTINIAEMIGYDVVFDKTLKQ